VADRPLSESSFSHIACAPIERVDIARWLFSLPNSEFRRCCPPDHIACGASTTDDGRRMSINAETIGDNLLIHQYVGEITAPHHCHMVSTSDLLTRYGRAPAQVVWDLSVEPLDEHTCEYINQLTATAGDEFVAMIERAEVRFDEVAVALHRALLAHNELETAGLASSIGRQALSS
jgi:hypothetical protein